MMLQLREICLLATLWLSIATLIDPDLSQAKKAGIANSRYLKPTSTTLVASSDTKPNQATSLRHNTKTVCQYLSYRRSQFAPEV